ncbi:MAG: ParA family protein [Deltaproteobacteria bacterium]|nr:ParA family protein [Deltaproteobacteria bacterium]
MHKGRTRIISVVNEKGGVGKTVTVVNVAAGLSVKGKTVLVVDVDPQLSATKGLGYDSSGNGATVYDVIKPTKPVAAEAAIVPTAWKGLDLLPSHVDLSGIEIELATKIGRENRLKRALKPVVDEYDFVLLDTPPSLSLLTVNVLAFAEEALIPCQTHPYAYAAIDDLLETIAVINEEINPRLDISGVVATFFDRRTRVSHQIMEKLEQDTRIKDKLYNTVIRINTTIAESAQHKKPVVFFRPASTGAQDYLALTEEILARSTA